MKTAIALAGLGLGGVSTGLAVMSFMRQQSRRVGGRVRYVGGQYLVNVRYFGGWTDIRDFIRPDDPQVRAVYEQTDPDPWSLFDYVCRYLSYRRDFGEYWKYPDETLRDGTGDCEDTSILLCSLLRNSSSSHVVLGSYQGYGHAWVYDGQILETTYTEARITPDPEHYKPYMYFDDRAVVELWPGALQDIYSVPRSEGTKLRLMSG